MRQKKDNQNFLVKKSRNGNGLFAQKSFKADTKILEIKGSFITCYEDDNVSDEISSNAYRFDEEWYVSPAGELGNFINHSCGPNSRIVKVGNTLFVYAVNDIKGGQEIFFDYSTIIARDDIWEMKCNCDSDVCRGIVKTFWSLPKDMRKRYIASGIVPAYIVAI